MKTRDEVSAEIRKFIAEHLELMKEVKEADHLIDDLGSDSLDLIEYVMAYEDMFDIEVPDEATEEIHTVKDAVDYVYRMIRINEGLGTEVPAPQDK